MKAVLIADVHGNYPALQAVLTEAQSQGAEVIWDLGDMTGYGPWPDRVVRALREHQAVSILGNYDRKVLSFARNKAKWRSKKAPQKLLAFERAHEGLSDESRQYLESLPEQCRLELEGVNVLLTHGSPAADDEALGPATPASRLAQLAGFGCADVIACAHSHEAFVREVDGVTFVNPGSVGRPEGGDPRACYAVLTFGAGHMEAELRRTNYDVDLVVRAVRSAGLPESFGEMFAQAKNLDQLQADRADAGQPDPPPCPCRQDAPRYEAALALARRCQYEAEHSRQVTRLALALFDELRPLHGMGPTQRFRLQCAAILHDIGWLHGRKGHHKSARDIILADTTVPFEPHERRIVAAVARYHRKALPQDHHQEYICLSAADQQRICMLAGLLRLADGLDRSHESLISELSCEVSAESIVVCCSAAGPAEAERLAAARKADLLETAFGRKVELRIRQICR